ncbi:hypothetical protein D3C74_230440 [compost metagenome]
MLLARFRHHDKAFHANALEAVRTGTGLKRPSPQYLPAGRLHQTSDLVDLFRRFYCARAAHDNQLAAADLDVTDRNDRIFRMKISASQFIGLRNLNDILDVLHLAKMFGELRFDQADQTDDGTILPAGNMGLHSFLLNHGDNFLNALLRGLV